MVVSVVSSQVRFADKCFNTFQIPLSNTLSTSLGLDPCHRENGVVPNFLEPKDLGSVSSSSTLSPQGPSSVSKVNSSTSDGWVPSRPSIGLLFKGFEKEKERTRENNHGG